MAVSAGEPANAAVEFADPHKGKATMVLGATQSRWSIWFDGIATDGHRPCRYTQNGDLIGTSGIRVDIAYGDGRRPSGAQAVDYQRGAPMDSLPAIVPKALGPLAATRRVGCSAHAAVGPRAGLAPDCHHGALFNAIGEC